MSDTPSLLQQLANKAKLLHRNTNISQAAMAKAIRVEEGNYSKFLTGKRGLSAESTCLLLKFMNMTAPQAVATLTQKALSSSVMQLQESGKRLKFNNSAALKLDSSTGLVDTSSSVTSTPAGPPNTIEAIIAALLKLKPADRQTVVAAIAKAVPNAAGSTAPNNQRFNRKY